jgi:hypothetical protein
MNYVNSNLPRINMKNVPCLSVRCSTFFSNTKGGEEVGNAIAMKYIRGFSTKIPRNNTIS